MKKKFMCMLGIILVLSLAACTPTPDKGKTGETKPTQQAGISAEKNPDPTAPNLDVVSIYSVSEDGSKLEGTMDAVEELTPQALADLLIQYGVLDEGTEVISYEAEGAPASQEVGPGVAKSAEGTSNEAKEYGVLNLNQFPDKSNELLLQAVANTYLENLQVTYMTIQVNGETVAENLVMTDAGK